MQRVASLCDEYLKSSVHSAVSIQYGVWQTTDAEPRHLVPYAFTLHMHGTVKRCSDQMDLAGAQRSFWGRHCCMSVLIRSLDL